MDGFFFLRDVRLVRKLILVLFLLLLKMQFKTLSLKSAVSPLHFAVGFFGAHDGEELWLIYPIQLLAHLLLIHLAAAQLIGFESTSMCCG